MRRASLLLTFMVASLLVSGRAFPADAPPAPGKPAYGTIGFDDAGADRSTRPGNDFFRYANGSWLDHTEIPADKAAYSVRAAMSDVVEQRLHELMEQSAAQVTHAPATLEGKVGAFYKAFMDETTTERLGARPLAPTLARIRAARTRTAIAALMGRNNADFEGSLFAVGIDVDVKDPDRYAVYVGQGGLGLPDRGYYLDSTLVAKKQQWEHYAATLLGLLDWPRPEQTAHDVVAFETEIARASWTRTQQRDPDATYNPMSIAALQRLAPGFAWREFFAAQGLPQLSRVVVAEKSAFPRLAALFARAPIATLQAWLAFTVADDAAPYLSKPFADAAFAMRGHALLGQAEPAARWKRGVHAVSGGDFGAGDRFDRFGNLGWGVGQLYASRWFPPQSKAAIEDLVANLKAAFHARLQRLDWMGDSTKVRALEKLDSYVIKVGYPEHPRDYTSVQILDDDLLGDVRRAGAADWSFNVKRLPGPVDRSDWGMTPQTNDAYNGGLRDIVFPAGILQPPIFDVNADPALNYGAAGAVIGHELTHGFDDQGRKFDAQGRLRDWWTPADAKTFEARAKVLGAQYSAYEPLPGAHVNGALTMGENIADLGGVTLALEAYHASLHGQPAPVLDGWTGDQRVLLGWAQAWRGKAKDDALRRQVLSDPHSPRKYRINGVVRNLDAWYDAFQVTPGDSLYLKPEDRVRIW